MDNWSQYINKEIPCSCGKMHFCDILHITVEENALQKLPEYVFEGNYKSVALVLDCNTEQAAGNMVYAHLMKNKIMFKKILFDEKELIPNEKAIGKILCELPDSYDLIIGIGSGTINDLCKYVSFILKTDYFIVATAPSMDGYASNVSVLTLKNSKTTLETTRPKVILADTAILACSPESMIAAGVGDILGKYVCLADWKLSHLITGEYFCETVYVLMKEAVDSLAQSMDKIAAADKDAIGIVMNSLILAGVGMSFLGNSRPASGSEHHLSHYWEMYFLQNKKPCPLHGTKVAIGTVIGLYFYHSLDGLLRNIPDVLNYTFDNKKWEAAIQKAYPFTYQSVLALEHSSHKNQEENVKERLFSLLEKKEEVLALSKVLPACEEIIGYLKSLNAFYLPSMIHINNDVLKNSIYYAKDLRNRYGILQLLYDIDKQETAFQAFSAYQQCILDERSK